MKDLASLQSAEDSLLSLQKQSVLYVFIYSADILIQFHRASAVGAVVTVNTFLEVLKTWKCQGILQRSGKSQG